jgi:hypothetical protein
MKKEENKGSITELLVRQKETLRKEQSRSSTAVDAFCVGTGTDTF